MIPKEVRDTLDLEPSDTILFLIDGETVYMRPRPASFTLRLRGLHGRIWDDVDAWLEAERAEWG